MITLNSILKLAQEVVSPSSPGYIRVPLAGGYFLDFLDRPGVWATTDKLASITSELRDIYSRAMPGQPVAEYGALSGRPEDLKRRVISIVRSPDGRAIAFCAQARLRVHFGHVSEEVIHLGLVAVDPQVRRGGVQGVLYSLPVLYLFFASGMSRLYFTNVTQVPAIIGQCEDYFSDVYPSSRAGAKQQFHHHRIAKTVYERYRSYFGVGDDSVYVPDRQIIQNSYTGGSDSLKKTFEQSAQHRRPEVNRFCRENLDYVRGDDFIQVGSMDYMGFVRYFMTRQKGNPIARALIASVAAFLNHMIIPVLQWITRG